MKKFILPALLLGAIVTSCSDDDGLSYEIMADNAAEPVKSSDGFYIVNEDWFGHSDGTVNYLKKNNDHYDISYRVYSEANNGETLGTTTCFSAIWGNNIYFVSKQGNRLVIADATTMKSKAVITDLGGDGRAFQGIDDKKAYVGTNEGIVIFNLESNTLGNKVEGIEGQVGSMAYSNGKVFAITADDINVIDPATDKVIKQIKGNCRQMTLDRKGDLFVGLEEKMLKIDSETLATEDVAYPENVQIADTWGMWTPQTMCPSNQTDHIYWIAANGWSGGKKIYKTDINTKTSQLIYTLGKSDNGGGMTFYGAGLRVDPLTDELITISNQGWGESAKYNWLYKLDNTGKEIMHQAMLDKNGEEYFWFPSLPVFEDANKPQILLNQVVLQNNMKAEFNLTEKVIDYDNFFSTMIISVESANPTIATASVKGNTLVVEPGTEEGLGTLTLSVVSNGVKVEKTIQVVNEL